MPEPTPLTRDQIEAKRAEGLAKTREANARALARQDAIHAKAYELHRAAMDDETITDKPGFDKALEAATQFVDANLATAGYPTGSSVPAKGDAEPTFEQKIEVIAAASQTTAVLLIPALKRQAAELGMDFNELLQTQYETALKTQAQS